MKKYLIPVISILFFCSQFAFADTSTSVSGAGTFQLVNFPSSMQATVSQPYSTYINFLYSGQGTEHVSVVGTHLPGGMTLGAVSYGINGVDNIKYSGTPTDAGDYPISLVLTDNSGTILNQPFDFKVSNLFTTTSLPDATVGQAYSAKIYFAGLASNSNIIGYNIPENLTLGLTTVTNQDSGAGYVTLTGTPYEPGTVSIQLGARQEDQQYPGLTIATLSLSVGAPAPQSATVTPPPPVSAVPVGSEPVQSVPVAVPAPVTQPTILPTKSTVPANQETQTPEQSVVTAATLSTQGATPTPPKKGFFARVASFFSKLKFW